eukprot:scaffold86223_cov62-Phaeocystis_antarctica.AAC.2
MARWSAAWRGIGRRTKLAGWLTALSFWRPTRKPILSNSQPAACRRSARGRPRAHGRDRAAAARGRRPAHHRRHPPPRPPRPPPHPPRRPRPPAPSQFRLGSSSGGRFCRRSPASTAAARCRSPRLGEISPRGSAASAQW